MRLHPARWMMMAATCLAPMCTALAEGGTLIELAVDAQQSAPNDLGRATVYVEMQDTNTAELARRVNAAMATVLGTSSKFPSVKSRSGNAGTYPVYGNKGNRIEAWRMRAELLLESRDMAALSELLGRLQSQAAVGEIQFSIAPDTRRRAEDEALKDALEQFRARAKLVAEQLGQPYRITQLSIHTGGLQPPMRPMMARAMSMAQVESAPMPMAAGEGVVTVGVSGKIELGR